MGSATSSTRATSAPEDPAAAVMDTDQAPLLQLPAELRNEIYEYVAGDEVVLADGRVSLRESALLSVCHQTRVEYLSIQQKIIPTSNIRAHFRCFEGLWLQITGNPALENKHLHSVRIIYHIKQGQPLRLSDFREWLFFCRYGYLSAFERSYFLRQQNSRGEEATL